VARVVAFVPDLLFGSNVVGALRAAGHEPVLVGNADSLREDLVGAEVLVVDLTHDAAERIEQVRLRRPPGVRTLAFYSHVETDVRARAEQAGFDAVVPRSRMAREGGALVDRLLSNLD
jgi:hypothetical protein